MARCKDIEVRCIDVLEGPVDGVRQFLARRKPTRWDASMEVDARYLDRIEALNFTMPMTTASPWTPSRRRK
jgi:regulator of PEP synthase PpsR (kinase-PPPase family)